MVNVRMTGVSTCIELAEMGISSISYVAMQFTEAVLGILSLHSRNKGGLALLCAKAKCASGT